MFGRGVDQLLAQENGNGTVLWALTDQLGTVKDLVDNSGSVANHVRYDSFGGVVSQSNPAFGSRYGFTGREFDAETGLYYYRSRYYNPGIGRFIGEDSVGFDGGDANLYRYVGNSPVDSIDPFGEAQGSFVNIRGSGVVEKDGAFLELRCVLSRSKTIATWLLISRPDPLREVSFTVRFDNKYTASIYQRINESNKDSAAGTVESAYPATYIDLYGKARGARYEKEIPNPGFVRAGCTNQTRSCEDLPLLA